MIKKVTIKYNENDEFNVDTLKRVDDGSFKLTHTKQKLFPKEKLENGMIITTVGGNKGMVIKGGMVSSLQLNCQNGFIVGPQNNHWDSLDSYDDFLMHKIIPNFDIVKIEKPKGPSDFSGNNYEKERNREVIWEREVNTNESKS